MSTYTKYHLRVKENISRFRNPGNVDDGTCPDRIIFANEENIYHGTFVGKVNPTNAEFNNATINGGQIHGAVLDDVTIKAGNQVISITDLTSNVSELSGNLDKLANVDFPHAISCLTNSLTQLSDEVSSISSYLSDEIGLSVGNINIALDSICSTISNDISNSISELSSKTIDAHDKIASLSAWSKDISSKTDNLSISSSVMSGMISTLEHEISGLSNSLSTLSSETSKTSSIILSELRSSVEWIDNEIGLINSTISDQISSSISCLSNEVSGLSNALDLSVESINESLDEIYDRIRGGLNFDGVLSIQSYETSPHTLQHLLSSNLVYIKDLAPSAVAGLSIEHGTFYVVHSDDPVRHYIYSGLEIEHGDWLIARRDFMLSNDVTSVDVAVFDAQDYDSFRINSDNVVNGDNIFNGLNKFKDISVQLAVAQSLSAESLSVGSGNLVFDGTSSLQQLSNDIYSNMSNISSNVDDNTDAIQKNLSSISYLSNQIDTKAKYFGNLATIQEQQTLQSLLNPFANADGQILKGSFGRISNRTHVVDSISNDVFVGINDYVIANKDIMLSDATWTDIDIVRDSYDETMKLSNDLSTLSNELSYTTTRLESKIEENTESIGIVKVDLETLASKSMHYAGDLSAGDDDTHLSGYLVHTYGTNPTISCGTMNHIIVSANVLDSSDVSVHLCKNDYIIFRNDISNIENITWNDIDIIRDAQVEAEELSTQLTSTIHDVSSNILTTINDVSVNLSNQLISTICSVSVELSDNLTEQISSVSSNILSTISSVSVELSDNLTEQISSVSSNILSTISRLSNDLSNQLTAQIYDVSSDILSTVSRLSDELTDTISNVSVDLSGYLTAQIDNVSSDILSTVSRLSNELSGNLLSTINATSVNLSTNLISTISSVSVELSNNFISSINNVSNYLSTNLISTISSVSVDLSNNFTSSINHVSNYLSTNLISTISSVSVELSNELTAQINEASSTINTNISKSISSITQLSALNINDNLQTFLSAVLKIRDMISALNDAVA